MRYARWVVLWVVLVAVFAGLLAGRCINYYRLMKFGKTTQGVAIARAPHMQIDYSFTVGGRAYSNIGVGEDSASYFEHTPPGSPVLVTFLPESPTTNCLGNPAALFSKELPPVLLGSTIFPTAIVIALAFKFGKLR